MSFTLAGIKSRISVFLDKESKTLFKNSSWVFISNATGTIYAFLRSIVIARGLGAETLGHYTVAIAFVLTVQEILKLNVGMGIIRYGAQYRSTNRPDKMVALIKAGVTASLASAGLSILVIGILLLFFYDNFITTPELGWFVFLYAIVNGISFLDNISKGILNLYYRFKINSTVQMIMDTLEFLMVASCIYFYKNNLEYFFITVIVTRLTNTLICNIAAAIEMSNEFRLYIHSPVSLIQDQYKEIRTYIIGNSLSNTLKTFMNQGDVLILSAWAGPAAVGLYAVAKKLAYSVLTLTDPLVKSIFPQLSVLVYEKKYKELKQMLRKITLLTTAMCTLFLLPSLFLKEGILNLVYGSQYIPAANTFIVHLIGALQGSIFFWTLPLINSLGLTGLRFRIYIISILGGIAVSWLTVDFAGATGVAAGLLTTNLIITILFLRYAAKHIEADQTTTLSNNHSL